MANSMRGEAEIELAGKTYAVTFNMGAVVELAAAFGVETMEELRLCVFKIPNMPKVLAAVLKANGHDVPAEELAQFDWTLYMRTVVPAMFRYQVGADTAEGSEPANPPKPAATTKKRAA